MVGVLENSISGRKVSQREMSKFVTLPESLALLRGESKGGLTTLVMEFKESNY